MKVRVVSISAGNIFKNRQKVSLPPKVHCSWMTQEPTCGLGVAFSDSGCCNSRDEPLLELTRHVKEVKEGVPRGYPWIPHCWSSLTPAPSACGRIRLK